MTSRSLTRAPKFLLLDSLESAGWGDAQCCALLVRGGNSPLGRVWSLWDGVSVAIGRQCSCCLPVCGYNFCKSYHLSFAECLHDFFVLRSDCIWILRSQQESQLHVKLEIPQAVATSSEFLQRTESLRGSTHGSVRSRASWLPLSLKLFLQSLAHVKYCNSSNCN